MNTKYYVSRFIPEGNGTSKEVELLGIVDTIEEGRKLIPSGWVLVNTDEWMERV